MLGMIANYCCVISRNSIIKQSVSLDDIWRKIHEHYGFQSTGSHTLELANITLLPNERHEDLYQRIMAFFEDNLLTANGNLTHHGESIDTDEDLSPTLENTIVVLWLKTIHPELPQLVKQRYGPELRNKTVASLKPEISLAMSSLLDELKSIEENRVLRVANPFPTRPRSSHSKRTVKSCILCKTANRTGVAPHFLSKCPFSIEADRRFMGRTRLIPGDDADNFDDPECKFTEDEECALLDTPSARRVAIVQSPYLSCFYNQYPVRVTLDTGASTNLVSQSFATSIDLPIKPASQFARQADGHTPLDVVDEISCTLHRGDSNFCLDALVVRKLDVDVLRAIPFWLSMTSRHVLQNGRWLWEVKTAMEPLQHAMCLSGEPYCSERHQNKQWLCLGITLNSHCPVNCLQMTHGHWNHVCTARSMPSLTHLLHGPHHRKSLQLATNSVWSTQPEVLSIYVALSMCARFVL